MLAQIEAFNLDFQLRNIFVAAKIEAGEITPVIDGVFLPEEAAEAHRRVEQEARLGGVVIQMKTPDAHPPKQTHNS